MVQKKKIQSKSHARGIINETVRSLRNSHEERYRTLQDEINAKRERVQSLRAYCQEEEKYSMFQRVKWNRQIAQLEEEIKLLRARKNEVSAEYKTVRDEMKQEIKELLHA